MNRFLKVLFVCFVIISAYCFGVYEKIRISRDAALIPRMDGAFFKIFPQMPEVEASIAARVKEKYGSQIHCAFVLSSDGNVGHVCIIDERGELTQKKRGDVLKFVKKELKKEKVSCGDLNWAIRTTEKSEGG